MRLTQRPGGEFPQRGRTFRNLSSDQRGQARLALVLGALVLSACAGEPVAQTATPLIEPTQGGTATPTGQPDQDLARTDAQGAVEVDVKPRVWSRDPGGTIEFEITMDTHSGDLSMNLAALSTLETELGVSLPALDWTGGSGHHVEGVLTFPASTPDGRPLLEGAAFLVLTIRDVDAPARVFQWNLSTLP